MSDDVLLDALQRLRAPAPSSTASWPTTARWPPRRSSGSGRPTRCRAGSTATALGSTPRPEVVRGIGDDWRAHLGDARLFGDWTAHLRREAADTDWRSLLLRWWPRLLPGLAASATHGVIRTAHAVRSLRAAGPNPDPLLVDELAQGLAFWAAASTGDTTLPVAADRFRRARPIS